MSSNSVYVHLEGASTWTRKISVSSEIVTIDDLLQAFSVTYEKKYAKKLQCDQFQVFLERNQDPLTRKSVQKSKSIRKALQLEDEEGKGVAAVEIVLVYSNKDQVHTETSTSTTTVNTKNGANMKQTQDQETLKALLQLAMQHMSKKSFRSAREVFTSLVLNIDPTNAIALIGLGEISFSGANYGVAISYFEKCWTANSTSKSVKSKGDWEQTFQCGLKIAKCHFNLKNVEKALLSLDELQGFIQKLQLNERQKKETLAKVNVLRAEVLYDTRKMENEELAISLVTHLLPDEELQGANPNLDALLLYARMAHDRKQPLEAMNMVLRVLVARSTDKKVKQQLVDFVQAPGGVARVEELLAHGPKTEGSAAAFAFLATILKDHGAIDESILFFSKACEAKPSSSSYALNYAHVLEIAEKYEEAHNALYQFCKSNGSAISVGGVLNGKDIAIALDKNGWNIHNTDSTHNWKVEWNGGEDGGHATVLLNGNVLNVAKSTEKTCIMNENQLDFLACCFTLVKILFLNGRNEAVARLISLIEPVRRIHKSIHQTTIRNENAYYSCIVQLLSTEQSLCSNFIAPKGKRKNVIYVCGDSHTLATAWRQVQVHQETMMLVPALVTGLKHWHLREDSSFYPKFNFWKAIAKIPKGSNVIFLFGEIDCREGILLAVEKCKYETIEEGMRHTVGIFMKVLQEVVKKFQFQAFIHPVVPVLNETRPLVIEYNRIFKSEVDSSKYCKWLDFFQDLVYDTPEKLRPEFALDGTHLHPYYLSYLAKALEVAVPEFK